MFSKKIVGALLAGAFALNFTAAQAQFVPEGQQPVSTVANILAQGKDDQYVTLQGYIIQKIGNDDYIFQDRTGQIIVDIDHEVFRGQKVSPQTKVLLQGEIDKDFTRPMEIDVDRLTVIQ